MGVPLEKSEIVGKVMKKHICAKIVFPLKLNNLIILRERDEFARLPKLEKNM